jgi:hypothetical protein
MRLWKVALVVGVLATIGLLAAVAIASGADRQLIGGERAAARDCSGDAASAQHAGSHGFGASEEMRAWREQYGENPYGDEAQAALDALRAQHQAENEAGGDEACGCDDDEIRGLGGEGYGRGGAMMGGGNEW